MITKEINDIFSAIKSKEYKILNATYHKSKDDKTETPIFKNFNFKDNDSNVFIIYGDNVSGKSMLTKVLETRLREDGISTRVVSMGERTTPSMKRVFLFGEDSSQSTGETSFTFLKKAFGGMINDDDEVRTVSIFDEPDIGLSSRYARALGHFFAEQEAKLDKNKAIVIISHNNDFLKSFLNHSESNISTLGINTDSSLEDWINDDTEYSIDDLLNLTNMGRMKNYGFERALREIKKNKNTK